MEKIKLAFKPDKKAFLIMRLVATVITFVALMTAVIVGAVLIESWLAIAAVLVIAVTIYDVADAKVAYRKQRYELTDKAAHYDTGSLFTDRNTELNFTNITHVRVKKPFIEYHLFGTGTIIIESAGSKDATIEMRSIKQPYEAFEKIRQLLAKNTFSLTYENLLSHKKPSPLAVMLGLIGGIAVAVGFIIFNIGLGVVVSFATSMPISVVIGAASILSAIGLGYLYVVYQDQLRRNYYVYTDVIHYSKGFLTKQEAFMPAANLANTRLTQNFIGKLLNLQDVIVSCQGQGSEINFANLNGGEDVQRAINNLINHRVDLKPNEIASERIATAASEQLVGRFTAPPTPKGEDATAQDFYMHLTRALASLAPLIVFPPVLAVALVAQIIVVKRTVFRLTEGGVASYYAFLTTKNVEFSRDKITGLVIRRNPLDRYFNTCTVSFWSIGSGASVDFKYIPYSQEIEALMQAKAGIVSDEELEVLRPQFSLANFGKANLWSILTGLALLVGSVLLAVMIDPWFVALTIVGVIGVVITLIVLKRRYARAYLRLGQHTTSLSIGVLFNKKFYARNDNIKDMTLTKYPLSTLGEIQFNIAGERLIDNNKTTIPNRFSIGYMPRVADEVSGKTAWLDQTLLQKPGRSAYAKLSSQSDSSPEAILVSRPSLKNSLTTQILYHVIILPLIIILPLSLALRCYWLRRVEYRLERDRVVKRWSVVYRKQHSILLERLDYTETGQGLFNKIFKNGNLYFYTTGSNQTELTLQDTADYRRFHAALKEIL